MDLNEAKQIAEATLRGIVNPDATTQALRNDCEFCRRALEWAIAEIESRGKTNG